jgi:hypothetical protein
VCVCVLLPTFHPTAEYNEDEEELPVAAKERAEEGERKEAALPKPAPAPSAEAVAAAAEQEEEEMEEVEEEEEDEMEEDEEGEGARENGRREGWEEEGETLREEESRTGEVKEEGGTLACPTRAWVSMCVVAWGMAPASCCRACCGQAKACRNGRLWVSFAMAGMCAV